MALARWLLSSAASTWLERPGFVPRRSGTRAEEDQVLPLLERVITPGTDPIAYWVWKLEWPATIKEKLINDTNSNGTLTINDLELACMVLGWLALKMLQLPLAFKDVGLFCDNTSAVSSLALKGSTSTSPYANGNAKHIPCFHCTFQA